MDSGNRFLAQSDHPSDTVRARSDEEIAEYNEVTTNTRLGVVLSQDIRMKLGRLISTDLCQDWVVDKTRLIGPGARLLAAERCGAAER